MKKILLLSLLFLTATPHRLFQDIEQEAPKPKGAQNYYKLTIKDNLENKERNGILISEAHKNGTNIGAFIVYEENAYPSKIRAVTFEFEKNDYTTLDANKAVYSFNKANYTFASKITPGGKGLKQDKNVQLTLSFKVTQSITEETAFSKTIGKEFEVKSSGNKNPFDYKVVKFEEYKYTGQIVLAILVFALIAIICGPITILIYGCYYLKSQIPGQKKALDGFSGISSLAFGLFSFIYVGMGGINGGRILAGFNAIALILVVCRRGEFKIIKEQKKKSYIILGIILVLAIITFILGEKFFFILCLSTPIGFCFDIHNSKSKAPIAKFGCFFVVGQYFAYLTDHFYGILIAMFAHPTNMVHFAIFAVLFVLSLLAILFTPSSESDSGQMKIPENSTIAKGYEIPVGNKMGRNNGDQDPNGAKVIEN